VVRVLLVCIMKSINMTGKNQMQIMQVRAAAKHHQQQQQQQGIFQCSAIGSNRSSGCFDGSEQKLKPRGLLS
jgi:hypothetical protein